MWFVSHLIIIFGGTVFGKLTGDNICYENVRTTTNVTEYKLRNSTIRHYKWCLNVPPRCSFYTTKLINDSQILEKEVTQVVEKCCNGYTEHIETQQCRPVCPDCHNGECLKGKCFCLPGFKGEHCIQTCDQFQWGANCQFRCDCNDNKCDPVKGQCFCLSKQIGKKCDKCSFGFYGKNCHNKCTCEDFPCDSKTGQCLYPSPTLSSIETTTPNVNNISFINNGKFISILSNGGNPSSTTKVSLASVKKHLDHTSGKEEEADLTEKKSELGTNNDFIQSASTASAIAVGILMIASIITAAKYLKKMIDEKNKENERKSVSTVAVYTHSIFHTPLPDLPTFESPMETNDSKIQTHVVYSLNFPAQTNAKDYLYDHPPSSGSYRAASIPEPPDPRGSDAEISFEPVYDEIPSGVPTAIVAPSFTSSSLYMNTCGKTKF